MKLVHVKLFAQNIAVNHMTGLPVTFHVEAVWMRYADA